MEVELKTRIELDVDFALELQGGLESRWILKRYGLGSPPAVVSLSKTLGSLPNSGMPFNNGRCDLASLC